MYKGVIVENGLADKSILGKVQVVRTWQDGAGRSMRCEWRRPRYQKSANVWQMVPGMSIFGNREKMM